MKASYKSALLSTFIFPGVGQLYLKKYLRGLVIIFLFCSGIGYIIWSASLSAIGRLDDVMAKMQSNTTNLQGLSDIIRSKTLNRDPYHEAVFYFVICIWIFAVIDAYIIGRKRESQDEDTSKL